MHKRCGGSFWDQWKRAVYLDPPLTNQSIQRFKDAPRESNVDMVLCSTMRRAEETALFLFPDAPVVYPVPFMKELGMGRGNKIAHHIEDQKLVLGERGKRLDYRYVMNKKGNWIKEAHETHYHKFLALLAQVVAESDKQSLRIAVVTHSNFMKKDIFKNQRQTTERWNGDQAVLAGPRCAGRGG
jgi:broad specificity phosphatase PhoE